MTDMIFGATPQNPVTPILPEWWRSVDRLTLALFFVLIGIGFLLIWATSGKLADAGHQDTSYFIWRHALFATSSAMILLITSVMPIATLRRICVGGFVIGLIALILLPLFGEDYGMGAKRWFSLGFSVQPSEFIKPVFVVFSTWLIALSKSKGISGNLLSFLFAVLVAFLLMLQPDYGQGLLIFFIWGLVYFLGGASLRWVGVITVFFTACFGAAYLLSEHFARRINSFLNADIDPFSQIGYAAKAIREGGLWGVGLGGGNVKANLPDAHTDFVIAVASEEFGLVCVFTIMILYLAITVRMLMRMARERDLFVRLSGSGLVALFGLQACVNMGVNVQAWPTKGLTLPFISYGGSSMLASGFLIGMVLAFGRERQQGEIADIFQGSARD